MKTLHWLIMGILCLVLPACSSNDEPDAPYTGPWAIGYYEEYSYMHNNSPEFVEWFNAHLECFVACKFIKGNAIYTFDDYVELDDYNNYPQGYIEWIEIVENATEEEIKAKVEHFKGFTIKDPKSTLEYDIFDASYKRYDGK